MGNTLSYTVDEGFDPTQVVTLPVFLKASDFIVRSGIDAKEYLAAIISYRRHNLSYTESISEDHIFDHNSIKALEVHMFNKREYSGAYDLFGMNDIQDPKEQIEEFRSNQQYIWDVIEGSSTNKEEAIAKIFSTNLRDTFDETFFSNSFEFLEMVKQKKLNKGDDGLWYLTNEGR